MSKFKEYKIDISDKNKKLIKDYLKKIKGFIDKNDLETDLYFDIEERVFEKLSNDWELNQLKIKQILNEIGEPDDIFELEESEKDTWYFRFVKNISNSAKRTLKRIFATGFNIKNLLLFIKTIIISSFKGIKILIIKLSTLFIVTLKKLLFCIKIIIIKWYKLSLLAIKSLYKILKIVFNFAWSFIGYIILWISILILFLLPIIYSGVEIWNINFTNVVPYQLMIAYTFLVLAIAILWIYFIVKKFFLLHFIVFGVSTILILSFGFLGSTKIYNNYSYIWETEENYILETDDDTIFFGYSKMNLYWNVYIDEEFFDDYSLVVKKSDDENFNIKIKTEIYTKNETRFKEIEKGLNKFELKEEDKNIMLNIKSRETFTEKTDFTPIYRSLEIYVPENKTLEVNEWLKYRYKFLLNCDSSKFKVLDNELTCLIEE